MVTLVFSGLTNQVQLFHLKILVDFKKDFKQLFMCFLSFYNVLNVIIPFYILKIHFI